MFFLEFFMHDKSPPLSAEEKLRNWRVRASTLGVAYLALGQFTQDVVRVTRSNGEMDFLKLQECRDRALLQAKDAEGLGLPIEDEARVLNGAMALLRRFLDFDETAKG